MGVCNTVVYETDAGDTVCVLFFKYNERDHHQRDGGVMLVMSGQGHPCFQCRQRENS